MFDVRCLMFDGSTKQEWMTGRSDMAGEATRVSERTRALSELTK